MMLDFQQKRKLRVILYNRITVVCILIFTIFALRSVWMVYKKERESALLRDEALSRLNTLQNHQSELEHQLAFLKTQQGIEAEIRSKFNVAKAGENIVVIVDDTSATTTQSKPKTFWQKILNFFRGA